MTGHRTDLNRAEGGGDDAGGLVSWNDSLWGYGVCGLPWVHIKKPFQAQARVLLNALKHIDPPHHII